MFSFLVFLKVGHSRPLFIYFLLIINKCSINFANDWSRTADLWYWKRPLNQLSHNHFPMFSFLFKVSRALWWCSVLHLSWLPERRTQRLCNHDRRMPISEQLWSKTYFKPFKRCLRSGYFLLLLQDFMLGTCMLLAGVRVHEHWWRQLKQ